VNTALKKPLGIATPATSGGLGIFRILQAHFCDNVASSISNNDSQKKISHQEKKSCKIEILVCILLALVRCKRRASKIVVP
jgi:hypothetical protein